MMAMSCLKYFKIDITNIGREIRDHWPTASMCINFLTWVFWKSYIHTPSVQDLEQKHFFINIIFYYTLIKKRYKSAMSVAFIIKMDNYSYSLSSKLQLIKMVASKVSEIQCNKKSDFDKWNRPQKFLNSL